MTHWQLSPEGTWERVDHETIAGASSWWVWNGKLHQTIGRVLMDGAPEDISVDESADGNLRIHVTLTNPMSIDGTGQPGDSLDLTLVMDPETFAIVGTRGRSARIPPSIPTSCLTYKEVATDGRIGIPIEIPESIRNELAISP